jgi:hypothetical protein
MQAEAPAKPAEPALLRLTRNLPGDSKPIVLHADHIATWTEGSRRVILLEGRVLIEQGIVHGTMREAMIWIDLDLLRRSKILHAEVLAEGDVHLEHGAETKEAPRALLDLHTRGEVKMNAHLGRVFQEAYTAAAIYQRAVAERLYTPRDTSVQTVSFQSPTGATNSTTLPSLPPSQPAPLAGYPAGSTPPNR